MGRELLERTYWGNHSSGFQKLVRSQIDTDGAADSNEAPLDHCEDQSAVDRSEDVVRALDDLQLLDASVGEISVRVQIREEDAGAGPVGSSP